MNSDLTNDRYVVLMALAGDLMSKIIEHSKDPGEGMVVIMGMIMIHGRLAGITAKEQVNAFNVVINSKLFTDIYETGFDLSDDEKKAKELLN